MLQQFNQKNKFTEIPLLFSISPKRNAWCSIFWVLGKNRLLDWKRWWQGGSHKLHRLPLWGLCNVRDIKHAVFCSRSDCYCCKNRKTCYFLEQEPNKHCYFRIICTVVRLQKFTHNVSIFTKNELLYREQSVIFGSFSWFVQDCLDHKIIILILER